RTPREVPPEPEVLGPVQEQRTRRCTVAARAADLLGVVVERSGDVVVHDEAHVGTVDAHPERTGRHHHDVLTARERLVDLTPSRATISSRTGGDAVAVSASTVG